MTSWIFIAVAVLLVGVAVQMWLQLGQRQLAAQVQRLRGLLERTRRGTRRFALASPISSRRRRRLSPGAKSCMAEFCRITKDSRRWKSGRSESGRRAIASTATPGTRPRTTGRDGDFRLCRSSGHDSVRPWSRAIPRRRSPSFDRKPGRLQGEETRARQKLDQVEILRESAEALNNQAEFDCEKF